MYPEPVVNERPAQPYVSIEQAVTMSTIDQVAHQITTVFDWLGEHGVAPAGAPFLKYNVIDMERELIVEAGIPVAEPVAGDDVVRSGVLPAGRFATLTYVGSPDNLIAVTGHLLDWAATAGLVFDRHPSEAGDVWACRLEMYLTDPATEPDMSRWETVLAFKLAD